MNLFRRIKHYFSPTLPEIEGSRYFSGFISVGFSSTQEYLNGVEIMQKYDKWFGLTAYAAADENDRWWLLIYSRHGALYVPEPLLDCAEFVYSKEHEGFVPELCKRDPSPDLQIPCILLDDGITVRYTDYPASKGHSNV